MGPSFVSTESYSSVKKLYVQNRNCLALTKKFSNQLWTTETFSKDRLQNKNVHQQPVHGNKCSWREGYASFHFTCLSVCRCCSCCCRFHWLCWMSSSIAGAEGGGIGGGAIIGIGGGGISTTSFAPGLYISAQTNKQAKTGLNVQSLRRSVSFV